VTLPRRNFLHLAAGAAATPTVWRNARAQSYPSRPVHLIIGYLPGGSADMTARIFGQLLSDRLGQQFVVESRAGGSTNIATEAVVRAAPDGYTLLLASPANATNVALYDKLNFDFLRETEPVGGLIRFPTGSIARSTPFSPTRRPRRGSPRSARRCFPAHPPISASSSPTKPRSGAK
jgi:tripartite-type tricarboxylate transporter receptor subunit TctC